MNVVPREAPVYGGGEIHLEIDQSLLCSVSDAEMANGSFYLVFMGTRLRHVTQANASWNASSVTLNSKVPGHNKPEVVQLTAYLSHLGEQRFLSSCSFQYLSDSAHQMASYLASSIDDSSALEDLELVCRERFQLTPEIQANLDERLTAAFKTLYLEPCWNMMGANKKGEGIKPSERLLHFSARLGLRQLSSHLLTLPGSQSCLSSLNHEGHLPEELARNGGFCELADMLEFYRKKETHGHWGHLSAAATVDDSFNQSVVTTNLGWSYRGIDYDIAELKRLHPKSAQDRRKGWHEGSRMDCLPLVRMLDKNEHKERCKVADSSFDEMPLFHACDMNTVSSPRYQARVLEDNLRRLRSIHEGIQRLRELNTQQIIVQNSNCQSNTPRLSNSCPSLSLTPISLGESNDASFDRGGGLMDMKNVHHRRASLTSPCSQDSELVEQDTIKICVNDATPVSSQECLNRTSQNSVNKISCVGDVHKTNHYIQKCHVSGTTAERCARKKVAKVKKTPVRRQSWSSLGISTTADEQEKVQIQRRWSLSSMDSDIDETFYSLPSSINCKPHIVSWESTTQLDSLNQKQWSVSSNTGVNCIVEQPGQPPGEILSNFDIVPEVKGLQIKEQEINEEFVHNNDIDPWPVLGTSNLQKSVSTPSILAAQEILEAAPQEVEKHDGSHGINDSDEDKPFGKRKKRGSLFFKKKWSKEKERDTKKTPHQFITVCYGNTATCDACLKPLANKPSLRCEKCLVTVHDSSCKDQVHDCNKFKTSKSPTKHNYLSSAKDRVPSHHLPSGYVPHYPYRYRQMLGPVSQSMLHLVSTSNNKHLHSNPIHVEKRQSAPSIQQLYSSQANSDLPSSEVDLRPPATISRVISEERNDMGEELLTNIIEANSASMESLDEGAQEISDLEDEPILHLMDDEPEAWSANVDKKILKKLKDKDVKRQEAIYELIMTEKHHCLTLKIMQKVFAEGLIKELNMSKEVDRFFPCLGELLEVHMSFLRKLRERQKQNIVIDKTGDILLEQFQGDTVEKMKVAYGLFCSNHKEAIALYKYFAKTEPKFQNFIKRCSIKRLCKTRGIPDCILLVTQRITKYPLLIQALIKATKDNKQEHQDLLQALHSVKVMISHVDTKVAEKERDRRLIEIYNKVDAKSTTFFHGKKFKKSDLLSNNRKLRYEGIVSWKNSRGKAIDVIAVVLSDFIFFLQENNQKYYFASLDNKPGVVSLQKLLVRSKAGQNSRGIFLISSNPCEPEMYELNCSSVKSQKTWIDIIREAVEQCPDEDEGVPSETEEERKLEEARAAKLNELINLLHEKDLNVAQLCEDKMRVLLEMLELVGVESEMFENIQYTHLLDSEKGSDVKEAMLSAWNNASRIASNLYTSGTNLSRSVSSAGEHQSESFVSPLLPKRAETFGGFDNPSKEHNLPTKVPIFKKKFLHFKEDPSEGVTLTSHKDRTDQEELNEYPLHLKEVELRSHPHTYSSFTSPEKQMHRHSAVSYSSQGIGSADREEELGIGQLVRLTATPLLVSQGKEQLQQIAELAHHLNTLTCILSHLSSRVDSLKTQLAEANDKMSKIATKDQKEGRDKRPLYRPEHQLEELRNLQEQLSQEREAWQRERIEQQMELDKQREELKHDQDQVKLYQADVDHQRELLYRKLEALQKEGIILSPSLTVVNLNSTQNKESEAVIDSNTSSTVIGDKSGSTDSLQHRRCVSFDLQRNQDESGSAVSSSATASSTNEKSRNNTKFRTSHSASCLPSPGKRDSVPLHLCSAAIMQKRPSISNQPIKQQLPLKLASKNVVSSNGVVTSVQSSQQILPMKLAIGSGALPSNIPSLSGRFPPKTTVPKRSHSAASSPSSTLASPVHVRGGSSPALVQTSSVPSGVAGSSPQNNQSDSPVQHLTKDEKEDRSMTNKKEESSQEIFC